MFVALKKDYLGHKAGATLDILEEPVAKSLLEQGVVEAVKGDPYGPLTAKAVDASIVALTKNIDQVITAAVQQMALAQTKNRKNAVPEIFGLGGEGDPNKNFMEIAGNKPLVPVVTVYTRRYAIEDNEDRFTLDVDVQTDLGKSLPFSVLEFKSNEFNPALSALLAIGLKPIRISKFLWATERRRKFK
jgi:hypothetical protein